MTGPDYIIVTHAYWRGYRRGHRDRMHPHRWTWIWSVLAFCLFGAALGVTWRATEIALANASIGEIVPKVVLGKIESWNRVFRKQ